jgi:putative GTP pyrophosphokinase
LSDGIDQRKFLDEYRRYIEETLEPMRQHVKGLLADWKDPAYWAAYLVSARHPAPSPVQRFRLRVKRPESAVDKILRKPESYPDGLSIDSLRRMPDTLGARVIVYFLSQLSLIDREIRQSRHFELSPDHPPVAYLPPHLHSQLGLEHIGRKEKESGYASIHYLLRLRHPAGKSGENPCFELQLRTLCEDLWGEVEHILGYKPEKRTSFAVRKQFRIVSRDLEALDEHFNFLYEELSRFQEEGVFADLDPLNAENLPHILRELSLGCAQGEIDGLLKLLYSRGIGTVHELRRVATLRRLELIRNVYLQEAGRQPGNFEYVANLANLSGVDDESEMLERIRSHREFLEYWAGFKESMGKR